MTEAAMQAGASARARPQTRERRREQLIRSTIDCIARHGFAETTLAKVAEGAHLSNGIVNFHFKSKEALLAATLDFLSHEYANAWRRALDDAGRSPAQQLLAMVMTDFEASVCTRKKIAVWFAFWGEAKSRPTYMKTCGAHDTRYQEALRDVCALVIDEGGYADMDADAAATTISALTDGLWLDLLIRPDSFTRERGRVLTRALLAALFPVHFPPVAPVGGPVR